MIDTSSQPLELIQLIPQPAFTVRDCQILQSNPAAQALLLTPGTDISPLLPCGTEALNVENAGSLCTTLVLNGVSYPAAVRWTDGVCLFLVDSMERELQALSLAAHQLRTPLSAVMGAANALLPMISVVNSGISQQLRDMNRGLLQLLRIVGNLSDAEQYLLSPDPQLEPTNLVSFLYELVEKTAALTEPLGIDLSFIPPAEDVTVWLDRQQVERCIYNLLSNSLRFTPRGGSIQLTLRLTRRHAVIRVTDSGEGLSQQVSDALFTRYLRPSAVEDSRYGMGLGLMLSRLIASAHGGAILIGPASGGGTEVALSIRLGAPEMTHFASPGIQVDYTGQWDHTLVELSGELPDEAFDYL